MRGPGVSRQRVALEADDPLGERASAHLVVRKDAGDLSVRLDVAGHRDVVRARVGELCLRDIEGQFDGGDETAIATRARHEASGDGAVVGLVRVSGDDDPERGVERVDHREDLALEAAAGIVGPGVVLKAPLMEQNHRRRDPTRAQLREESVGAPGLVDERQAGHGLLRRHRSRPFERHAQERDLHVPELLDRVCREHGLPVRAEHVRP